MSFKSKNLSYEAREPAFLRKLREQQAGTDTDRLERPVARPRKAKVVDDDDDGPTIVDPESNQTLSKEEYEQLVADEENKGKEVLVEDTANSSAEKDHDKEQTQRKKQEVTEAGLANKKRKAVKAVAVDEADGPAHDESEQSRKDSKPQARKPKKKIKAVKLSFDQPEE